MNQVPAFSSLVGGLRYVLTRDRMTTFFCFSVGSSVVHLDVFLVISQMRTHVVDTSLHQAIGRSRRHHSCCSRTCLTHPHLLYCGKPFGSGAQFSIPPSLAPPFPHTPPPPPIVTVQLTWVRQQSVCSVLGFWSVRLLCFPQLLCSRSPSLMPRDEWTEVMRRKQRRDQRCERRDRDPWPRRERRPEWQCSQCNSRNWLRQTTDAVIGATSQNSLHNPPRAETEDVCPSGRRGPQSSVRSRPPASPFVRTAC